MDDINDTIDAILERDAAIKRIKMLETANTLNFSRYLWAAEKYFAATGTRLDMAEFNGQFGRAEYEKAQELEQELKREE